MKDQPIILTTSALMRILKSFAIRTGLEDQFADALAQVHLQTTDMHIRWDGFMRKNCVGCRFSVEDCRFFHPTERDVAESSTTPKRVSNANMMMIELGKYVNCPIREEGK